ncbi:MAG: RNA recognition motif [bacterium ADurb.Bin212]|jgi:RNA recognition motif-containing protein|nr:MAG: RNA recognition motif [bacterium ADurb.Bin212]
MEEQVNKNKLFVGNLDYSVTDEMLSELFSGVEGVVVVEAKVISDKFSGRSKGFGFVTVESEEMAEKAIEELNEKEFEGRKIFVNVARPMVKRDENRGGGGYNRNDR